MSYSIRVTAHAGADIERLYASIVVRRGTQAAERWYESYTTAAQRLRTMPLACGLAYENPRFTVELRHLLFGIHPKRRYRALFTVQGEEVVILAVRAPGEQPVNPDDIEADKPPNPR
jgi:plasmid stabilization system protein ParE